MTRVNMKIAHKKTQTHALLVVRLTVQNYGMYPIILILKLGHKKKKLCCTKPLKTLALDCDAWECV